MTPERKQQLADLVARMEVAEARIKAADGSDAEILNEVLGLTGEMIAAIKEVAEELLAANKEMTSAIADLLFDADVTIAKAHEQRLASALASGKAAA